MRAGYALPPDRLKNDAFLVQEGLIGTSFSQKKLLHIVGVRENNTNVLSGLGVGKPREMIFVPLIFDNNALGVIELATFYKLEPHQIQLLEQVAEASATSLLNLETAKHSEEMLNELQRFKDKIG